MEKGPFAFIKGKLIPQTRLKTYNFRIKLYSDFSSYACPCMQRVPFGPTEGK
jgi:hypothetical protein